MSRGRRGKERLRTQKSLRRPTPSIPERERLLIMCEGAETEPTYFDRFRTEKRLSTQLIQIVGGERGTNPKTIVENAKKRQKDARQEGLKFDRVWCVFDRNEHEHIEEAFNQARDNHFSIAFSNPSFELWFLLHFEQQGAALSRKQACERLRKHVPRYDKAKDVYDSLISGQAQAVTRAVTLRRQYAQEGGVPPNPYTDVDLLVEYLNALKPAGATAIIEG